ncbi:hypothetical protein [Comamonas sp. SCN 67-35]|mgnify:CR=1 FL=1|uniref:hypothetical protein n=1 Tax=Comamonas sp. SCN 67-35 TaxID=1660096 RepID=UPI000AB3545F|nr:hypothetical protein [Comamonas sp. SCN 67-35]
MVEGEDKNKKDESKGFAGLSSLVSDVDTSPPPAAKREPTSTSGASSSPHPHPPPSAQTAPAQPQPRQQQTYQEPSQPSSGSSGGKWVLGIAAVIGVLWLIGQADKPTTSSAPTYSPPVQSAAPSYSPPAQPQEPSRPAESQPPVGQNTVLSTAQIRYCMAEDIRMDGAKAAVNNYIDADVERFNAMVADYNSRCGSFRYRSGALESARRDIEPYRGQLQSEGRSRFARPSTGSPSTPAPVQSNPSTAVSSAQSRTVPGLESLTYDEKDAIETACILKRSEGAASYNRCISAQIAALANAPRTPDLSSLSYDEKDAIETACILKRSEGAASYNRCLASQLSALSNAPRKPDLSGLSYDEKDAIETACILKRSEGAASYNRCVVAQLRALANAPRLPSLAGLSYDEKDAIETACILKRSEGAASYNRCVVTQLRALGR